MVWIWKKIKNNLVSQHGQYRGILHALWRIITEEGFFELYRGLAPSIIGVIPYAGVNYYTYDSLRSLYKKVTKEDRVGNIQTLIIGSLAGAIASTSTFPLEVARKQMQVGYPIITSHFMSRWQKNSMVFEHDLKLVCSLQCWIGI